MCFGPEQLFALTTVTPLAWCSCMAEELSFSARTYVCVSACACVWSWVNRFSVANSEGPDTNPVPPHTFEKGHRHWRPFLMKLAPWCMFSCAHMCVSLCVWVCVCVGLFAGLKPKSAHERCVSQCCFSCVSDRKQTRAAVFGFSKLTQDSISNMGRNSKQKCSMSGDNKANVMSLVNFNSADRSPLFQIYQFSVNEKMKILCVYWNQTHWCFVFTSEDCFNNLIPICFAWCRVNPPPSVVSVCVLAVKHLQSSPAATPAGVLCYLCNAALPKHRDHGGWHLDSTGGGGGGEDEQHSDQKREKRGELWRVYHHIRANVLARPVESSLSSLITWR